MIPIQLRKDRSGGKPQCSAASRRVFDNRSDNLISRFIIAEITGNLTDKWLLSQELRKPVAIVHDRIYRS